MESLGDILKRLTPERTPGSGNVSSNPEEQTQEPECPICRGRGWLRADVPVEDQRFGKAILCRCQAATTREDHLARLKRYSDLGLLGRFTLENLDPRGRNSDKEDQDLFREALAGAKAFADAPRGWLVLTGPSGCGKTALASATANRCMERGHPALFVVVPDLLDHLRAAYAPSNEGSYDEQFDRVRNVPILVLDDLGSHSSTPWAQEKLFQILNYRFNTDLPTIVTLDVPLEELDERLRTRLTDPRLCAVYMLQRHKTPTPPGMGAPEPALLEQMTFATFDIRGNGADAQGRESLEAALHASREFARGPDGWLVLTGVNGCGKTHLAVAIYSERIRAGQAAYFFYVPDLLDHFRYTFSPESRVTYSQLFEQVRNTPLLILDDLGSQSSTPWADEKLHQIIVHRHNARLPTVITTSANPDDLSGPIASRLKDATLVQIIPVMAPDYRDKGRNRTPQKAPRSKGEYPRRYKSS